MYRNLFNDETRLRSRGNIPPYSYKDEPEIVSDLLTRSRKVKVIYNGLSNMVKWGVVVVRTRSVGTVVSENDWIN